jgi:hypothetical protein
VWGILLFQLPPNVFAKMNQERFGAEHHEYGTRA